MLIVLDRARAPKTRGTRLERAQNALQRALKPPHDPHLLLGQKRRKTHPHAREPPELARCRDERPKPGLKLRIAREPDVYLRVNLSKLSQKDPRKPVERAQNLCLFQPPQPEVQISSTLQTLRVLADFALFHERPDRIQRLRGKGLGVLATGRPKELRRLSEV